MRVLLDENLPADLRKDFPAHEIFSIRYLGWAGKKNGALLKLMLENGFKALLTYDKNLRYQQNFSKYPITVFLLAAPLNTYDELTKLSPQVATYLDSGNPPIGSVLILPPPIPPKT